jgi:hypothetical protein
MSDGAAPGHPTDKRPDKTKLAFWKSFLRHFFEKNFNVGFLKLAPRRWRCCRKGWRQAKTKEKGSETPWLTQLKA